MNFDDQYPKRLSDMIVSERERVREGGSVEYVNELQVNRQKEAPFRLLVFEMLQENKDHRWEENDLVNSCAEELGISPTTARKYLSKLCSSRGVLTRKVINGTRYITFKIEDFFQ